MDKDEATIRGSTEKMDRAISRRDGTLSKMDKEKQKLEELQEELKHIDAMMSSRDSPTILERQEVEEKLTLSTALRRASSTTVCALSQWLGCWKPISTTCNLEYRRNVAKNVTVVLGLTSPNQTAVSWASTGTMADGMVHLHGAGAQLFCGSRSEHPDRMPYSA